MKRGARHCSPKVFASNSALSKSCAKSCRWSRPPKSRIYRPTPLKRRHAALILRLSPRRLGMRLADALAIGERPVA
jgi:hypothetical protein